MIRKSFLVCLAAGLFIVQPMNADAAQISLALAGGISTSLDESSTSDNELADVLDEVVKDNYTGFCIAKVNDYVNVRSEPSEDGEVLGKLFNKSVGTVEAEENGWYLINSGNVHGYVKNDYVAIGIDAESLAEEAGTRVAVVTTETLRVRQDATTDSSILGLIPMAEELTVTDETEDFVKVSIEEGDGWVSKDYVDLRTDYVYAESREEEKARLAKEEEARQAAQKAAESKVKSQSGSKSAPAVGSGAGSASGNAVASFASQFVGNPYVYGGTSLTNGADCSGFVMSVYANFGVGLPHSSSALRGAGYGVSLADAQPGDIICYSGHVGIYVGNNTIVHASTAATGIKYTSPANYKDVLAVRRIF
ncbi:MAG: SH3 domain-containing protein [Lachnospiraceae bacterium]|nr:SH3 domain-containing protein [Lachnospiraceae bacterium]